MKWNMKFLMLLLFLSTTLLTADVSSDYIFGKQLFDDTYFDESLDIFEKIITNQPTSVEAEKSLFYSGKAYKILQKYDLAQKKFYRLYEGYPASFLAEENLYNLAEILSLQKKYDESAQYFSKMIKKYPRSDYAQKSLIPLLEAKFQSEKFQEVITLSQLYEIQYKNSDYLPFIYLYEAKANYELKYNEKGENILNNIIDKFPDSDASWESKLIKLSKLDDRKAISYLEKYLAAEIPRNFEEKYSSKLIEIYIKKAEYEKADNELDRILGKFTNSENIANFVLQSQKVKIILNESNEIIENSKSQKKYFKNNPLIAEFYLYLAKAYFMKNDYLNSLETLNQIDSQNPQNIFNKQFLLAKISYNKNDFAQAISTAKDITIIQSNNPEISSIYMFIGNTYLEKLNKPNEALQNYQNVIAKTSDNQLLQKGYFQIALCYETKNEYEKALQILDKIDISIVQNNEFKKKIINKQKYLINYKISNHEVALHKLITSLATFLKSDDKANLETQLTEILIQDLKDFDSGLALLEKQNGDNLYQLADIYLKQAGKAIFEGKISKKELAFAKLDSIKVNFPDEKELIDKIKIEKYLIANDNISEEIYSTMVNYITFYDNELSKNQYRIILSKIEKDESKKEQWLNNLTYVDGLNKAEFSKAKIRLGEIYYAKKNYELAKVNYDKAKDLITIEKPSVFFHYAYSIAQNKQMEIAEEKLAYLIRNQNNFAEMNEAIYFLSSIYRDKHNIDEAITCMNNIELQNRDDEFYSTITQDYISTNNIEAAKNALLYIQKKSIAQLEQLAELHYLTNDMEMANFTYLQLLAKEQKNYYTLRLAHINFIKENYKDSEKYFKDIYTDIETIEDSLISVPLRTKEYIITLFKNKHRPQAKKEYNKFKQHFDEKIKSEIEISKAIYYVDIDPSQSKKILNKLIKKEKHQDLLAKERFWRGISLMKLKEKDKAEADFKFALNSEISEFSTKASLKLGTIKFSQEKYQEALDYYYKVIEEDKNGKLAFDAAKNFAIVCKTIKEWQKAIDAYEIILERWGDENLQSETVFDIAFCYYRDKKFQKSITMFKKSLSLLDDDMQKAEAQYWIGDSYFGMEDYENAVTAYLKVSYNYPSITRWAATAELQAAESYIRQNNFIKAKKILNRIITKYGIGSNWGNQARTKLAKL